MEATRPVQIVIGPPSAAQTKIIEDFREAEKSLGIGLTPVNHDPEHPIHPDAKLSCSLLNRHLQPVTGLREIPPAGSPLIESAKARAGLSILTGVDALRRAGKTGGILERPEIGLPAESRRALGDYLSELWTRKKFRTVTATESWEIVGGLANAVEEGRIPAKDVHILHTGGES